MPSQVITSTENNFTKGLITEFTGLNFPENAATDTDNCTYTVIGDVTRRLGIDYEVNANIRADTFSGATIVDVALNSYIWKNAGGDGETQILVQQRGDTLSFYKINLATDASPLTNTIFHGDAFNNFQVSGTLSDLNSTECQFSDGNGYLFVYHPLCTPFFVTLNYPAVTFTAININIRDFSGIPDNITPSQRPTTLSTEHSYNLTNQGWVIGNPWQAGSSTPFTQPSVTGVHVFVTSAGLPIVLGTIVRCQGTNSFSSTYGNSVILIGTVTAYAGVNLTVNVTSFSTTGGPEIGGPYTNWIITPTNTGYVGPWFAAEGNYPSNSDVWWYFKNAAGAFDPATTQPNVTISIGNAPRGHFVLDAFNQSRTTVSGIPGINDVTTGKRPSTGTWFQGRVWFSGIDDSQQAIGNAPYYTWTENIYFSQTVVTSADFGICYQTNDPTSETLFGLLPTDGGVITIQGAGKIFKLFPIQNGLLVFASNGVWFITGSTGIGFSANDYTITKISEIRSMSSTSFVNVQGWPYFWNEEGIYEVSSNKTGNIDINPITLGTIKTYYDNIPTVSKKYVRGDYHSIDYTIQWIFKSVDETTLTSRYQFDKIMNYNTANKAFFPYSLSGVPKIHTINYISQPGDILGMTPAFKYFASDPSALLTAFADEHDERYVDFFQYNNAGQTFESFFVTGYKVHGQGQRRFQMPYVYVFSRTNDLSTSYKIQGLWDYATSGNTGRWSLPQIVNIYQPDYAMVFRRHKIRGQGIVLQIKVRSVEGQPFDIMGWSTFETTNQGI